MIAKAVSNLTGKMIKNGYCKEEDREIVAYGLVSFINLSLGAITTIAIGLWLDLFIHSIIFLISFSVLRSYAGGYHCKKSSTCYFLSTGLMAFSLLCIKYIPVDFYLQIGITALIFAVAVISKFAPLETETKPLDECEKLHYRKKSMMYLLIECVIVTLLFVTKQNMFGFVISLAVFLSGVVVLIEVVIIKLSKILQ